MSNSSSSVFIASTNMNVGFNVLMGLDLIEFGPTVAARRCTSTPATISRGALSAVVSTAPSLRPSRASRERYGSNPSWRLGREAIDPFLDYMESM
jgi:hypothetical protein